MTKRGAAFLILSALTLLAAFATGLSEIFLVAALCGFVLAFALVSTLAGVLALRISHRVAPDTVARGEKVRIEIRFEGLLLFPVVVFASLRLPEGKIYRCADMLIGRNHTLTYDDFDCPHRGLWEVGVFKVRCGDIFGLFSLPPLRFRKKKQTARLLVCPLLYQIDDSALPPSPCVNYTENQSAASDQGDSFSDIRLYRSGDSLKRIHWKMTVRTGDLYTRQYEMSLENTAVVLLDTSVCRRLSPDAALAYADMASECGAAIVYRCLRIGLCVRILPTGNADRNLFVRTQDEFSDAYRLFAAISFQDSLSLKEFIAGQKEELARMSLLYIITDTPDLPVQQAFSELRALRSRMVFLCPRAEDKKGGPAGPSLLSDGMLLVPLSRPRDIREMGEYL